jgi:predicted outer membrane repeat protein
VSNITLADARTSGQGGAIYNNGGILNVDNVTFSNNVSVGGGAIYSAGFSDSYATTNVTNSTFSGNSIYFASWGGRGGAILNQAYSRMTVINSTFSGNSAPYWRDNGNVITGSAIHNYNSSGTVTLINTIIANGSAANVANCVAANGSTFTDGGGNLEDRNGCGFTAGTSKINTNPLLGTLGSYGGVTKTFPLLPGSPAIDAGVSATCSASPVSNLDQRGVTRPSSCDSGAFESRGFTLSTLTGTPQGTRYNTAFASPLGLTVSSSFSEPLANGKVTFTPPASGASAAITTTPATIGSDGKVSVTATANGTGGSYNVVASAVGATSVNFALTNGNNATTITTLGSSLNPAPYGQSVTFTATVSPTPTGGTVTFKDGGSDIAGCVALSLSSGQATCATATLSLGAHTITADYSGYDTFYNSTGTLSSSQQIDCGSAVVVTSNTDNGPGSLRQAIAGICDDGGTITFNNDYTITLASTLTIEKNLTIDGETHNVIISGNNAVRVFYVNPETTFNLKYLTVTKGKTYNSNGGGGILSDRITTLNITNCTFSDNESLTNGGGAISIMGNMTVTNSTFSGNSSRYAGGIWSWNSKTRNITNSTFIGNRATEGGGGAIYNQQGTLNVTNSTFSGNSATTGSGHSGRGAGIYSESGRVNVTNSTYFGNNADNGGSGIYSVTAAYATLKNVILDNSSGRGSNCYSPPTDGGGNLENSNDCGFGASRSNKNLLLGTFGYYPGTAATKTYPLLPGSPAIDAGVTGCDATDQRGVARVGACDSGAFESQGFTLGSLTGTPQSAIIPAAFGTPLGLTVTSATSEPVAGGRVTFTPPSTGASATIATSPATIDSDGKVSVSATTNSEIGRYSVVASATGAAGKFFELINKIITTTTRLSSSTNPSVLGQSVTFTATVSTPGSNTPIVTFKDGASILCDSVEVKFHDSGDGVATATCTTSALTQGAHTITAVYSDLNGGGALDATLTQTVNSCTNDITVYNDTDNESGSLRQAIAELCPGGTITFDGDYTILLSSELAIAKNMTIDGTGHKVTVSGNHTTRVFNVTTGTAVAFKRLTIADGNTQTTDCGNATDGSASSEICGGGLILQNSSVGVTVTDSTFSGNKAVFGGSIFNGGTLTVTNSTFSGNSADYGGGVINAGTLTMTNSTFSGNYATVNGGGINNLGTLNLYNSILANSTSGNDCWKTLGTVTGNNNLIETDSPTKACGTTSPINNTDPKLADTLAYNGGETQTFALLPGSPAINAGTATDAPSTDQRGILRATQGGAGYDIGAYEVVYATPTVTGISPASGTTVGGASVTITGTNFTDAIGVTIGGTAATSLYVVSSTSITAVTPVGTAGAQDVVVTVPGGSGTGTGLFTYIPTVDRYVDSAATTGAYNGTSWANAFTNLQDALASTSGGTIYVAKGTYKPGTNRTDTFQLKNNVTLQGGYPTGGGTRDSKANVTILSGNIGDTEVNTDNSYNVVTASGTDSSAILEGFTVSGGNGDDSDGGGMRNVNGSPTIREVTFSDNRASYGGGMYNDGGSPTLTNVTFSNNLAQYNGGGIHGIDAGNPVLQNVTFSGNSADYGGGMYNENTMSLTNVTFSGNTANTSGGGIYSSNGNLTLMNVTFNGNSASQGNGGALFKDGGTVTATNCIFWGNSEEIYKNNPVTVTYSVVESGYAEGTNILTTDPLLDTLKDNGGFTKTMRLKTGSPAIDAGTPTGAPSTDQRGITRPQNALYDIGAYEVAPSTVTGISPTIGPTAGGTSVTITGTNFLNGVTTVSIGGTAATSVVVVSATSITAITPPGTAGYQDVVVTTPDGIGTGDKIFIYVVPSPTVTTGTASSITPTTATLGGSVNANGADTTITFQYRLSTGDGSSLSGTPATVSGTSATAVSAAITDLTCNTTYDFRVIGVSSSGTVNGSDASFTTSACPALSVSKGAASVAENAGVGPTTVTITRNTDTTSALTVNLSSSDTTEATVPATATILAGQPSVTVNLTAVDDAIVDGTQAVTITATATGFTSGTTTIQVTDNDVPTYTVSYNANGATSGTAPVSQIKTQNIPLTLASNTGTLAKTWYTFAGWNTAANGSGTNYAPGATYSGNAALTLYAKWTTTDTTGPTLTVSTLANGSKTKDATLNVAGTVSDSGSGVKSVTVNGTAATNITNGSFSVAITLVDGANSITTIATDNVGNTTTDTRSITLDQTAPGLTITLPADNSITNKTSVEVTGTVDDSMATITANGSTTGVTMNGNNFSVTLDLTSGLNTIDITATDQAGNSGSKKLSITSDSTVPSIAITVPPRDITTPQGNITIKGTVAESVTNVTVTITVDDQTFPATVTDGSFSYEVSLPTEKTYAILATATDQAGNQTSAPRNIIKSATSPSGDINGDGVVDIADALKALRIAVGLETPTESDYANGDVAPLVNVIPAPDGVIDIADATVILMRVVGLRSW